MFCSDVTTDAIRRSHKLALFIRLFEVNDRNRDFSPASMWNVGSLRKIACELLSTLVVNEKDGDLHKHVYGLAVQFVRLETPLPNSVHHGLGY